MKTCTKCKRTKSESAYYPYLRASGQSGLMQPCKDCFKDRVKANYRANIDHYKAYEKTRFRRPERKAQQLEYQRKRRSEFPGKCRARQKVNNMIRDGHLKRLPCEACGDPKSQAHHDDYRKPLDIRWLCFKHHREAHGQTVND